ARIAMNTITTRSSSRVKPKEAKPAGGLIACEVCAPLRRRVSKRGPAETHELRVSVPAFSGTNPSAPSISPPFLAGLEGSFGTITSLLETAKKIVRDSWRHALTIPTFIRPRPQGRSVEI